MDTLKAEKSLLIIKTDDDQEALNVLKTKFQIDGLALTDGLQISLETDNRSEIAAALVNAGIGLKEMKLQQSSLGRNIFGLDRKREGSRMRTLIKMNGSKSRKKKSTWIMLGLLVVLTFGLTYVVRLGSPDTKSQRSIYFSKRHDVIFEFICCYCGSFSGSRRI